MLSERAAAAVLAARQGLGREQARQLLMTGAAGAGRRVGRSTRYDDDLVHDLAIRFDLEPPGAWREAVEGRWFHTGPGRHWFSWHPPG